MDDEYSIAAQRYDILSFINITAFDNFCSIS